jgi:hypothetical protein
MTLLEQTAQKQEQQKQQEQQRQKWDEVLSAVRTALEDDRFDWRTIAGLTRALHTDSETITRALSDLSDGIVRATAEDGRVLYTTRNHYEEKYGFGDKLLSALADKVVA